MRIKQHINDVTESVKIVKTTSVIIVRNYKLTSFQNEMAQFLPFQDCCLINISRGPEGQKPRS